MPIATPFVACHLEMIWATRRFRIARIARLQDEKLSFFWIMSELRADRHGRHERFVNRSIDDDANAFLAAASRAARILFGRFYIVFR